MLLFSEHQTAWSAQGWWKEDKEAFLSVLPSQRDKSASVLWSSALLDSLYKAKQQQSWVQHWEKHIPHPGKGRS